jgi:hypothetical protein
LIVSAVIFGISKFYQSISTLYSAVVPQNLDVTMLVTVESSRKNSPYYRINKSHELKDVIDIGINNNSPKTIMITSVSLIPQWITGFCTGGGMPIQKDYNVILDDWFNMLANCFPISRSAEQCTLLIAQGRAKRESDIVWVSPDPKLITEIPGGKYLIKANSPDRFRLSLGLSNHLGSCTLSGKVILKIQTDKGNTLVSEPFEIAVCGPRQ